MIKAAVNKKSKTQSPQSFDLLALEAKYCSWGDTVHYADKLNIFKSADGSFLYDDNGAREALPKALKKS